jgi:RNA polymerase sigma-70 factor (ECF subfamily)
MLLSRDNDAWIAHLRTPGPDRDAAIQDLLTWLQKRLFFYLRDRSDLRGLHDGELQAMSADFAQESVLIILQKLDQFAGRSKFTTWAAKIAVHRALGELRRARWRDVSLQAVTLDGAYEPDFLRREAVVSPEGSAIQQEAMDVVMDVMQNELSERQSRALYARLVLGMPSDVLAQELGISHNTLYKLIHDARKRLKARLLQRGLSPEDILAAFQ